MLALFETTRTHSCARI